MTAEANNTNPFEAYQHDELDLVPPRPATQEAQQPGSMIAIALLVIIASLVAIIAWRGRSK